MRARRRSAAHDLWVVLPVRGIARGKRRLAEVLEPGERARLNAKLLRHTLHVLRASLGSLERCICVSPCTRALTLARRLGAQALREPSPGRGLNRAIGYALRLAVRAGARRTLILPADLPLLSREAAAGLALVRTDTRLTIASDRAGTGTNALLSRVPARCPLHFGPESFFLHRQAARARGWNVATCSVPQLTFDLDTPEDLAAWRALGQRRWGR